MYLRISDDELEDNSRSHAGSSTLCATQADSVEETLRSIDDFFDESLYAFSPE
jgi:hypothetical protein